MVQVRKIKIGTGIPKVCVPIIGQTRADIIKAAQAGVAAQADLIEWRADWYQQVFEAEAVVETLVLLRQSLGEVPLLFTFRTAREGGEQSADLDAYMALLKRAVQTGLIDLVDIELLSGEQAIQEVIAAAHIKGVKVIVSNHEFQQTPDSGDIVERLWQMRKLGADIPKIAVMPQCSSDVLSLLAATETAVGQLDCPIITMSMGGRGAVSRLCGEVFGSAVTFGAVGQGSAPGQIEVAKLRTTLEIIHQSMVE